MLQGGDDGGETKSGANGANGVVPVVPVVLAMDANSHPQITPVAVEGGEEGGEGAERTSVWRSFRDAHSVWSAFFDRNDGRFLAKTAGGVRDGGVPLLVDVQDASVRKSVICRRKSSITKGRKGGGWPDAWAPVSVNKMRGPDSDQPKKIGLHAYHVIDHIFYNDGETMVQGDAHVIAPVRYGELEQALSALLPTLEMPSDHYPVVVDFV